MGVRINEGKVLTGHVNHATVTVLYQVARLTVDAARSDAVGGKEVRVNGLGPAVAPWRGQVGQLQVNMIRKERQWKERKNSLIHIQKEKTVTELLKPFCVTHSHARTRPLIIH